MLNGASVIYGGVFELSAILDYDFRTENEFNYSGLTMSEIIRHLAKFVARLWQIHIFCEGNTRTTAVFFIKYLKSLGFDATNDIFAKNAWYFRNALVRANYNDFSHGIREDMSYLEFFLRNLLMGEHNELKNRYLHVDWPKTAHSDTKQHIEQHIEVKNSLFDALNSTSVSAKTKKHILILFDKYGTEKIFSRSDVVSTLTITERPASALLKKMLDAGLTEQIKGIGKGKYRFVIRKDSE